MIRFIHTADIHFGMENYGTIDPSTGIHTRLLDFERALLECIDYAIKHQVDFFLFSGDAYKTATPTPTHQRLLMGCFLKLYKAHIPVVILVGNHDHPMSFGKTHALNIFGELPIDGFTVIDKPTSMVLVTKSGPVSLVGIPWPTRNTITLNNNYATHTSTDIAHMISAAVAHIIEQEAAQLDPHIPAVLAGHLTVSSGIFSGSEKRAIYGNDPVLMPSQLAVHPFDYVGLGHLHRYQNLNPHGYPAIVYSGSIERIDFGERKDVKGFCDVTIHEKGRTTHRFIPVTTRPFIQIEVQINDTKDQTEQLLESCLAHDLTNAVVKILYHLPAHTDDTIDIRAIQKACAKAHYIVGIIPLREIKTKERRAAISSDHTTIESAVTEYFSHKEECKERSHELIKKTIELHLIDESI